MAIPLRWKLNSTGLLKWNAEFSDRQLEGDFRFEIAHRHGRQLARAGIFAALVFLSFCALDFDLFGVGRLFVQLLALRLVTASALIALVWGLAQGESHVPSSRKATMAESVLFVSLLVAATLYPVKDLSSVREGIIVLVFATYLVVPSRWILSSAVALAGSLGSAAIVGIRLHGPTHAWLSFTALLALSNIIGSTTSFHLHSLHRFQYYLMQGAKRANERLKLAAQTDSLTGLLNHQSFVRAAMARMMSAQQDGVSHSVLFVDVDHFKSINDEFGHNIGDQCLRKIASICRASFRNGDLIGRMGGEEFAVFMSDADEEVAATLAKRLRAAVTTAEVSGLPSKRLTVTIGVAACTSAEESVEPALQRADVAMYRGKRGGRDCVVRASSQPALALAKRAASI